MTSSTANEKTEKNKRSKKEIVISDEDAKTIAKKLGAGRALVLICYVALLIMFTVLNITRETGSIKLWLVETIPLLIFLPALFKVTHRTYSWLCFVMLIYFVAIVPILMSRWWWTDWLITLLICCLFVGAMMTSRWLQYWNYYLFKKSQSENM